MAASYVIQGPAGRAMRESWPSAPGVVVEWLLRPVGHNPARMLAVFADRQAALAVVRQSSRQAAEWMPRRPLVKPPAAYLVRDIDPDRQSAGVLLLGMARQLVWGTLPLPLSEPFNVHAWLTVIDVLAETYRREAAGW